MPDTTKATTPDAAIPLPAIRKLRLGVEEFRTLDPPVPKGSYALGTQGWYTDCDCNTPGTCYNTACTCPGQTCEQTCAQTCQYTICAATCAGGNTCDYETCPSWCPCPTLHC